MSETFLGRFDLASEIDRLDPGDSKAARRSELLVKTDRFRIVLMTMLAGAQLPEHSAAGPIMIQGLRGEFVFSAAGEQTPLPPGGLIVLAGGVKHSVRAVRDGAVLLTIGWDPSWHGDSGGSGSTQ